MACVDATDGIDEVWAKSPVEAVETWAKDLDDEGDYDIAMMGGCHDVLVWCPDGKVRTLDLLAHAQTRITYTATERR